MSFALVATVRSSPSPPPATSTSLSARMAGAIRESESSAKNVIRCMVGSREAVKGIPVGVGVSTHCRYVDSSSERRSRVFHPVELILALLAVTVVLGLLARRLGVAEPILLVVGGLLLGLQPWAPSI